MTVTAVDTLFTRARMENRAALLPYMTAGLPTPGDSLDLFRAMADAGADGFELGIPYSDPLMDGPTIHSAGLRALRAGTTLATAVDLVVDVVEATGLPVFVMTYVNPVLRVGVDTFTSRIAEAGAAGLIVADLPVDEADPFLVAAEGAGIGSVLFAAPTTDDLRLDRVVGAAPCFVYAVARLGVTGTRSGATEAGFRSAATEPGFRSGATEAGFRSDATEAGGRRSPLPDLAARIRKRGDVPIVAGVGIATPEHAALAAREVDGVIVGSALVQRVLDAETAEEAARSLHGAVADLATAVRR